MHPKYRFIPLCISDHNHVSLSTWTLPGSLTRTWASPVQEACLFKSPGTSMIPDSQVCCSLKKKKKKKKRLWTSSLKHSLFSAISTSQFSCSVMSDSLQPHGLQHARPSCPSPTPRVYSNSCPSTQWCHPTISTSVIPFSSSRQSFPESGSFLMSHFFTSGGQSIGASASTSVLPMTIRLISFKMEWLDLLAVQGTLKSLLQHHSLKASILWHSAFFMVQLSHPYMTTGKTIALTRWTTVGKLISLLFKHCLVLP